MADELPPVVAHFEAESEGYDETVDHIIERLVELSGMEATPTAELEAPDFDEEVDHLADQVAYIDGLVGIAHAYLDAPEVEAQVAAINAGLDNLYDQLSKWPDMDVTVEELQHLFDLVQGQLALFEKGYNLAVGMTDEEAQDKAGLLLATLEKLQRDWVVTVTVIDNLAGLRDAESQLNTWIANTQRVLDIRGQATTGGPGGGGLFSLPALPPDLAALTGPGAKPEYPSGANWAALAGFGAAGHRLGIPFTGVGLPVAGFGTLGGLAGFGAESMLTTAAGLGGTLLGAGIGAGALAYGAAGTAAVGMGTDLAGIGQAAGDTRKYNQALNSLNQAIAVYGAGSTEAAHAQNQLNYTVSQFPAAAQGSIVALGQTTQQFHTMFNAATGEAEAKGAQILQGIVTMAESFLPTIGHFASQNMTIIQGALGPLEMWMKGPGLTIFTQLEAQFQAHLPAAMTVFTQGLELMIRLLGFLSPLTGHIIDDLAKWATELNNQDYSKLTGGISTAIGAFQSLWGLIKAVGTAIYELFTHDAGTGKSVIDSITGMVNQFNNWAKTVAGGDQLHNLLEAHKNELLAIIGIIPHLVSAFGQFHILAAPPVMEMVGLLAKFVDLILSTPVIGQILAMGLALGVMGSKIPFVDMSKFGNLIKDVVVSGLNALGGVLSGLGGPLGKLGQWLSGIGQTGPTMEESASVMSGAADSMSASADRIAAAFESVQAAIVDATTVVDAEAANMTEALAVLAEGADTTAASVDTDLASIPTTMTATTATVTGESATMGADLEGIGGAASVMAGEFSTATAATEGDLATLSGAVGTTAGAVGAETATIEADVGGIATTTGATAAAVTGEAATIDTDLSGIGAAASVMAGGVTASTSTAEGDLGGLAAAASTTTAAVDTDMGEVGAATLAMSGAFTRNVGTAETEMEGMAGTAATTSAEVDAALATEGKIPPVVGPTVVPGAAPSTAATTAETAAKGGGLIGFVGGLVPGISIAALAVAATTIVHEILGERKTPLGQPVPGTPAQQFQQTTAAAPAIAAGVSTGPVSESWLKMMADPKTWGMFNQGLTLAQEGSIRLSGNLSSLEAATGLSQTGVQGLAKVLGVNLNSALSPGQIVQFIHYVQQNGGAAAVTGQLWTTSGQQIQAALTAMSTKAETAMPNISSAARNMVTSTQPQLVNLVSNLQNTGDRSGASFISAFLAHLGPAQLASKQMHDGINSPLEPLVSELNQLGDHAAAQMVQSFINHKPAAQQGAQDTHDAMKNPLYTLQTELASVGDVSGAQLVAMFLKHNADANTVAGVVHDSINGKLAGLEQSLGSIGDTAAANLVAGIGTAATSGNWSFIGQVIDQGMAGGIQANGGLVTGAAASVAANAIATTAFHSLGAHSPSRVTAELLGKPFVQGMALGILENGHLVHAATASVMGGVTSGTLATSRAAAIFANAASGGGASVTINMPINAGGGGLDSINPNAVAQDVAAQIRQVQLRNARMYGQRAGVLGSYAGSR